jgi:uncharacterized membrane protein YqjE
MKRSSLPFLIAFVVIVGAVLAVIQLPQYRNPIVYIALVVLVISVIVVVWTIRIARKQQRK